MPSLPGSPRGPRRKNRVNTRASFSTIVYLSDRNLVDRLVRRIQRLLSDQLDPARREFNTMFLSLHDFRPLTGGPGGPITPGVPGIPAEPGQP